MRRFGLGIALTFVTSAWGVTTTTEGLSLSANYLWHRNEPNRLESTLARDFRTFSWLNLSLRGRLGLTHTQWHTLEWAGEAEFPLSTYFVPTARLLNVSHLAHGTHHTGLLFKAGTRTPELLGTYGFLEIGWFARWVALTSAMPVPFWGGTSFFEHDFAFAIGVSGAVSDRVTWDLRGATYDLLDAHNFNQPFVQASVALDDVTKESQWSLIFRNDLQLGFGRTHSWRWGVTYRQYFTPAFSSRN